MIRKKITNKTKYYTEGVTKTYNMVGEYDCVDAQIHRQSDMVMRLAHEIKRYNDSGGIVIMCTLTYDDRHLPKYKDRDFNGNEYEFPCFSRSDIQAWTHSISDHLRRYYGYKGNKGRKDNFEVSFRYVCGAEYGDHLQYIDRHGELRTGTDRPHIHPLLFFPKYIADQLDEYAIMNLCKKYWNNGWVLFPHTEDGLLNLYVRNEFAGEYVSKYCTKDIAFYDNNLVNNYLYPNGVYDSEGNHNKPDPERVRKIKDYKPFFFTSQHVGEGLKDLYKTYEDFRDGVNLDFDTDYRNGKTVYRRAPLYIIRKTLQYYDRDEQRYKHTELGRQYKVRMREDRIRQSAEEFSERYSPIGIRKKISNDQVKENFAEHNIDSILKLSEFIDKLLSGRPPEEFYLYNNIWRGVAVPTSNYLGDYEARFNTMPLDELRASSMELYYMQLCEDTYDVFVSDGYFTYNTPKVLLYDNYHRFRNYNLLAKILDKIDDIHRCAKHAWYTERRYAKKEHKLTA